MNSIFNTFKVMIPRYLRNTFKKLTPRSLRKSLRKVIPRSMGERLIRKITLKNIETMQNFVIINLKLRNFYSYNINKKMSVEILNGEQRKVLEHSIKNNLLSIKLCDEILDSMSGNSTITISVEGQNMIIDMDKSIENQTSFFKEGKYYNFAVNGTIVLEHLLAEYTFNEVPLSPNSKEIGYEHIHLTFESRLDLTDYNMALLYANKIVELTNIGRGSVMSADDFQNITMGKAVLYVIQGFEMTPVNIVNEDFELITRTHNLKFVNENSRSCAYIENHELELTSIENKVNEEYIQLSISYDDDVEIDKLVVVDTLSGEEEMFTVENTEKEIKAALPVKTLVNQFSRKKFQFVTIGSEPVTLQLNVSNVDVSTFNERSIINYEYQNIKLWFYKRKDKGLGFKVTRPRIKRLVTEIEDFTLKGFIEGTENFVKCESYIIFEDRYTKEQIRMPVDSEFDIDLTKTDLKQIKSKDKTILDIFIGIIHQDGEIIRKEKIKYQYSNYKKDNYYGSYSERDVSGEMHYHLITTTPFDNLKIESFSIPKEVSIPDAGQSKDYNIWLVGERYDTAQDNGYAFYKYLRDNTDIDAYYTIENTAPDYEKIKSDPYVLAFGSSDHFDISFKAGVLLGTHDLENLLPYKPARGFFNYEDTVRVFLQHGVLGRKRVEYHKKYYDLPFDLFIVSSEPEKYNVVMKKLGYEEEDVAITGLARFDLLPRGNKTKDILLMPTWRDWINTDEAFMTSKYFHNYNGLIHNERLIQLLEDYDVQLNFYPHYRAQSYFNDEMLNPSSNINFIQLGTKTVQELLIEHSLLITDYSSVSFDFTLMNKPVIYYHFDVRKFFRQGKLRPLYQTFIGDIARTEDDLVDLIEQQIKLNFQSEQPDITGIFEYQDHRNSERIYESVKDKINNDNVESKYHDGM